MPARKMVARRKPVKKKPIKKRPRVPSIGIRGQHAGIRVGGSRYTITRGQDIFTVGKLPTRPKVVRKK
jgi:hypothetical protein